MGEKDITEKLLEDYNDVFADIINVLVFHGEPIVNEQDLETDFARNQYKAGILGTQEMKHVEEVLNLMYAVTGDQVFEDAQNEAARKEINTMRECFNSVREEGRLETVSSYLETCVEYGVPYEVAVSKIETTYLLSQKEAEKYARKYYPKNKRTKLQPA